MQGVDNTYLIVNLAHNRRFSNCLWPSAVYNSVPGNKKAARSSAALWFCSIGGSAPDRPPGIMISALQ